MRAAGHNTHSAGFATQLARARAGKMSMRVDTGQSTFLPTRAGR
jgi:hypothetical protein